MASLDISPTRVRPNQAGKIVMFIGTGTAWMTSAPTFTPSGVAGVSIGSVTVVNDTLATAPVTYGANNGVLTWTDSTTSATRNQQIGAFFPRWVPRR